MKISLKIKFYGCGIKRVKLKVNLSLCTGLDRRLELQEIGAATISRLPAHEGGKLELRTEQGQHKFQC